jgi:ParB family chromosome partitioning protein
MLGKGLESLIPPKPGDGQNNEQSNEPMTKQPLAANFDPFASSADANPTPVFRTEPQSVFGANQPSVFPTMASVTPPSVPAVSVPDNPVAPVDRPVVFAKLEEEEAAAPENLPTEEITPASFPTDPQPKSPVSNKDPFPAAPVAPQALALDDNKDLPVLKSSADLAYEAEENLLEKKSEAVFQIEVEKIVPNPEQPRRYFNEEALRELANSIREFGIIQPLVVSRISKENENGTEVSYELIAGERRLMAAKMVGLRTVPAIVKHISVGREKLELAIIENIQRSDLNPVEEARAYSRLQDEFRMTQREIASRLGKSRETVANAMRLLNLPSEIQSALEMGQLNESQARLLLQIDDIAKQKDIFYSILADKPSVRALKQRIKESSSPKIEVRSVDPTLDAIKNRLEEILGTRVDIKTEGDKGKITINFYSSEELSSLIEKLVKQNDNQFL